MKVVVVGLGNTLVSDDAVGVRVIQALSTRELPFGVQLVERAVLGVDLIDILLDADRAILVDAVNGGGRPGTILRLSESDLPRGGQGQLSGHELKLPELLTLGRLLYPERMPAEILLMGIEAESLAPFQEGLSPAVRDAVPKAAEMILEQLEVKRAP